MTHAEADATVAQPRTLTIAEGAIDPDTRVQRGEISAQTVNELAERLTTDEFYDDIDPTAIPCTCVDGRGRADGHQDLSPNAAGGTFSLVMGDALSGGRYRQAGEKAAGHAKRVYGELMKLGKRIGGHSDDHAEKPNSGCGAQDKLDSQSADQPSILAYLSRRGDEIRGVLGSIDPSISVNDSLHGQIIANAAKLKAEAYATNGDELRQAFVETSGPASVETLTGGHNEVVVVVNTQASKTLDRQKVAEAFGNDYQVFNLDVAALQAGCDALALTTAEKHNMFVAALYYNIAVAAVLAGPSLRVIVR